MLFLLGTCGFAGERQAFPFDSLIVQEGHLGSSLVYNPLTNYPPKLRWDFGLSFKRIQPPGEAAPDSPSLNFSADLGFTDWKSLPGDHPVDPPKSTAFLINAANYGPVDLRQVTIKPIGHRTYEITLDLLFRFAKTPFKEARRTITYRAKYAGFRFETPAWDEPEKVQFPQSWKVPSVSPAWSDKETREFVSRHVDLSAYGKVTIDRNDERTLLEAKP